MNKSRTASINTLLFDWDGTLFDSAVAGFVAFEKTFNDLGVSFSSAFYAANYSPNWYSMYEALSLPSDSWSKADELWLHHYGEQPPSLVEGARETILEIKKRGYRMGVVTSGTQRRVTREMNELGLDDVFALVLCNEHVTNKKPHPEGLETAMATLKSSNESCCYVGDAPEDIEMGKTAGIFTIGVVSAYPTSLRLREAQPDIHVDSISELLDYF